MSDSKQLGSFDSLARRKRKRIRNRKRIRSNTRADNREMQPEITAQAASAVKF